MKTILVDAVNCFIVDGKVNEEMHKLLEEFSNRKIILTNANDEQLVEFGLVDLPYELFTLKHSPDKVDPDYFKKMLEHFSLSSSDVVYFEHNEKAVDSAKSIGITSFHYKGDLEEIEAFLRENLE